MDSHNPGFPISHVFYQPWIFRIAEFSRNVIPAADEWLLYDTITKQKQKDRVLDMDSIRFLNLNKLRIPKRIPLEHRALHQMSVIPRTICSIHINIFLCFQGIKIKCNSNIIQRRYIIHVEIFLKGRDDQLRVMSHWLRLKDINKNFALSTYHID